MHRIGRGIFANALKLLEHTLHPVIDATVRGISTGKSGNGRHAKPRLNHSSLLWVQALLERDL
jgi:hypothetical protein